MKILLIEDNDDDATLVRVHLNRADRQGYVLRHVSTLQKGIEGLHRERWDAVLLDLGLPESQGLDTLRLFRTAGRDVPVIVLSDSSDPELALEALQHGAHDVLDKSDITEQSLVRSLRYAQERFRLVQELRHRTMHDPLTGLPNRAFFDEQVERAIAESGYNSDPFVILFLDLDGFKLINDLGGHEAGDKLIVDVANRLRDFVRKGDVLSRLGGDEFAAIVFGVEGREQAEQVASRIHATLSEPFLVGTNRVKVSSSVGIVPCRGESDLNPSITRAELLRGADMAMYAAKASGPGRTQFFDDAMRRSLVDRALLEQALQHALQRNELKLHYQPIIDLTSGSLMGLEALCRWMPDDRPPVSPVVFIPIAEHTGLIQPIGRWVLRQACEDFAEWKRSRIIDEVTPGHVTLHVNISRLQLSDVSLVSTIAEAMEEFGIEPSELTIEVTESCIIEDDALAHRVFAEIKSLGVKLCIDDFGVGYSSLGHLRRFPFDCLKIDRSFVAQLDDATGEPGILLEAIASLAASLGLETVAEGIETEEQANQVRRIGCPFAQGFLFARPAPIETFLNPAPTEALATC